MCILRNTRSHLGSAEAEKYCMRILHLTKQIDLISKVKPICNFERAFTLYLRVCYHFSQLVRVYAPHNMNVLWYEKMYLIYKGCEYHGQDFFLLFIKLKRVWKEIFKLIFSWISFPWALEYPTVAIAKFYEISRRYSQLLAGNKLDNKHAPHYLYCLIS